MPALLIEHGAMGQNDHVLPSAVEIANDLASVARREANFTKRRTITWDGAGHGEQTAAN